MRNSKEALQLHERVRYEIDKTETVSIRAKDGGEGRYNIM